MGWGVGGGRAPRRWLLSASQPRFLFLVNIKYSSAPAKGPSVSLVMVQSRDINRGGRWPGRRSGGVEMRRFRFADHLLLFDSTVLEPDGDLALGEVRGGRDAPALLFGDELAGRVLLL